MSIPVIARTGSNGVKFYTYNVELGLDLLHSVDCGKVNEIAVSDSGEQITFYNGRKLTVLDASNKFRVIFEYDSCNITGFVLSPCGNILAAYEKLCTDSKVENDTSWLRFFDLRSGKQLNRARHCDPHCWKPQWTSDSLLSVRNQDGEIFVNMHNNFDEPPVCGFYVHRMKQFSLSQLSAKTYLAVYIEELKARRSAIQVFRWIDGQFISFLSHAFSPFAYVDFFWNDYGKDLLILSIHEEQDEYRLYHMAMEEPEDDILVQMPRPGPIYQVAWKPVLYPLRSTASYTAAGEKRIMDNVFAACYGNCFASVSFFGTDRRPLFNLDVGPWERMYFNPCGTLIMLASCESAPGSVSVWRCNTQEKLSQFVPKNTTHLCWAPDGEHLVLSTTAPQPERNHEFSVWHYTGARLALLPIERRITSRYAEPNVQIYHSLNKVVALPVPKPPPPPILFPQRMDLPVTQTLPKDGNTEGDSNTSSEKVEDKEETMTVVVERSYQVESGQLNTVPQKSAKRKRRRKKAFKCKDVGAFGDTSTEKVAVNTDMHNEQTETVAAPESEQYSNTSEKPRKRKRNKRKAQSTGAPERDAKTGILTEALFRLSM